MVGVIKDNEVQYITKPEDFQGLMDDSVYDAVFEYLEEKEKKAQEEIEYQKELKEGFRSAIKRAKYERDVVETILKLLMDDIRVVLNLGDTIPQQETLDRLRQTMRNTERMLDPENKTTI